jgi:adenine-specific DNA-methyltransferase
LLGFRVVSNDWEPYATTIGRAYLETNASDIEELFGSFGPFEQILHHLNTLPDPPLEEQYIARYYAPSTDDIEKADYRKERLFYTRQNALRIDRIRNEIDRLYPPASRDRLSRCRDLLIALLLYEAATHTNTSGVFKAYHRGFGGHGKDALGRILRPIRLEPPPLIDSPAPCRMYGEDATSLIRSLGFSFDLVYLDPPYNQHQYGSNYHLLNTIALWDKAPVPLELGSYGRLKNKAGIRKDWKRTKSPYCYRETAIEAFSELLSALDAEHVLISYSTDGIIPFETLRELCAERGEVSILTNEYITYRGGKAE